MPDITLGIELLLIALAVALITRRTRRPYTIALVIWGLILGFLRLLEPVHLSKELALAARHLLRRPARGCAGGPGFGPAGQPHRA